MTDEQLLQAISTMIDNKLEPINTRLNSIEKNMATKDDLSQVEKRLYSLTEEFYVYQKECNTDIQDSLDTMTARNKMLETATVDNTKEIINLKRVK